MAKFRESLSRPLSERFFDEDELIDFFDFAGDLNDDYLRMEALICAARFYPDSEELRQRKAIFFSQFSDEARQKCVEDNAESVGLIWDLLRARCADPESIDDRRALLDQIVAEYTDFSDEEVIQVVDLASSFELIDWLKDNINLLRKKAQFVNVLLYEVAVAADYVQDFDFAISLLEELTELEPFNAGFWTLLAKEYASTEEFDKALNAIEYSLAIEPSDPTALYVKAKALFSTNAPRQEVKSVLLKIIDIDDSLVEATKMLAFIAAEDGDKEGALAIFEAYIDKYPNMAISIVPDMLEYNPKNLDKLLDSFFEANEDNNKALWNAWAHHLMSNGCPDQSQAVMEAYARNSGEDMMTLVAIENLFFQRKFSETIEVISKYLDRNEYSSLVEYPSLVIMHLISLLKIGELVKAYAFCLLLESKFVDRNIGLVSQRIEYVGMTKIVSDVKSKLMKPKDKDEWADYDPLGLWAH